MYRIYNKKQAQVSSFYDLAPYDDYLKNHKTMTYLNLKANASNGFLVVQKVEASEPSGRKHIERKRGVTGSSLKRKANQPRQQSTQTNTDFTELNVTGNRDIINLMDYSPLLTLTRPGTQLNHHK